LRLGAAKQRALLALLLIRRGEVGRDVLVDALWGGRSPKGARNTLQVYVSKLRKSLGRDAIETTATGYRLLVDGGAVDSERFESLFAEGREALAAGNPARAAGQLSAALGLWRGPALADMRYEAFAQAETGRLDELRVACLEERIEADLALGRHAALVGELEARILEQPLRERLRAQLITALYRSGRQSEALDQYQSTRRMLADELGLQPSVELRELERMILAHDPALALAEPTGKPDSNLPLQPTPFIGRQREVVEIVELIRTGSRRLVTLTGAGGSGKTRLAIEATGALAYDYPDGVWWVPLQSLADPQLVSQAIATGIGAKAEPAWFIRDKRMLILLDNFEHLLDAAIVAGELLTTCPNLQLLATSREPLRLVAERTVHVQPMEEDDAVALFEERAGEGGDSNAVAEICRRVDCLPLAVELAAARTRTLSAEEILDRLVERLPLLTGGPRDAPVRQQTLKATIAWSYDLLAPNEQAVFSRLSVFAGGCTQDAAEAVCGATPDRLDSLTEKNLLVRRDGRYMLLDTIQEYARERLVASCEAQALREAHSAWYFELAEQLHRDLPDTNAFTPELARRWGPWVDSELENLRAVLRHKIERGEREQALRFALLLFAFWRKGARYATEGERWVRQALDSDGPTEDRTLAWALNLYGGCLVAAGRTVEGEKPIEQALELAERLQDCDLQHNCLLGLTLIAANARDTDTAERLLEAAREVKVSDPYWEFIAIHLDGQIAAAAGPPPADIADTARARELFEEAALLLPRLTDRPMAAAFHEWGFALVAMQENAPDADERFQRVLRSSVSLDQERDIYENLLFMGEIAERRGDLIRAGTLWGSVLRILEEQTPDWVPQYERYMRLDSRCEPDLLRSVQEGRELSREEAVAYALSETDDLAIPQITKPVSSSPTTTDRLSTARSAGSS